MFHKNKFKDIMRVGTLPTFVKISLPMLILSFLIWKEFEFWVQPDRELHLQHTLEKQLLAPDIDSAYRVFLSKYKEYQEHRDSTIRIDITRVTQHFLNTYEKSPRQSNR